MNRLSPHDAMFYFLDRSGSTMHLGSLLVMESPGDTGGAPPPLDYPRLVELVENRLQLVPRYRQVVQEVSFGLARPVWVDDPDFDINFHIRRAGLPFPGDNDQLEDLVARVMSRPLDRSRPLWEMYLIEGLPDGRRAILTKTHRCLVDGDTALEISEVICDETAETERLPEDLWMPGSPPGVTHLTFDALSEALSRPGDLLDSLVHGNAIASDVRSTADAVLRRVGGVVQQLTDSAPPSRLNGAATSTRVFVMASVPRRGCAKIADRFDCTVSDVELAIIAGVIRRWMLSFEESVDVGETVRAVLPLCTRDPTVQRRADVPERWISVGKPSFVTDLPVGEDNPAVRIAQVAGLANRYSQSARRLSMGLRPLLPELGMVPFPELSSRAFRNVNQRSYNVPVAMGAGPVIPQYVAGLPVSQVYSIPPLMAQRALAISVIDYRDTLQFAFIADRGILGDLPAMTDYVRESFEELTTT